MNNARIPRQAILKGQQNAAPIWSRNIAPSATASASIGPNAMVAPIHESEDNA